MQLCLRSTDGSLRRPEALQAMPDFQGENGELVVVDSGVIGELGISVMAGDDSDPPAHYGYEAELHATSELLVVRVVQRESSTGLLIGVRPERTEWRISHDGGRSWRAVSATPSLDGARLLDRITAGL